jgi:hypothetical protein
MRRVAGVGKSATVFAQPWGDVNAREYYRAEYPNSRQWFPALDRAAGQPLVDLPHVEMTIK